MAKDAITDYSQDAAQNTDVGGVSILGTASPRNLRLAQSEMMAQLADMNAGAAPLDDTFTVRDPDDTTKTARLDVVNVPTSTARVIDAEALYQVAESGIGDSGIKILSNYLSGFRTSNNVTDAINDIDIEAGACLDSTNTEVIVLPAGLTKRLDAPWAVGTNQGGLDGGVIANTTYAVYAIKRVDTGVVDVLFSTSFNAPVLPANYTVFRRIGSIVRTSGAIWLYSQFGDDFLLNTPILDYDSTQNASASSRTVSVPVGASVFAKLRVRGTHSTDAWGVLFSSLDIANTEPVLLGAPGLTIGSPGGVSDRNEIEIRTNAAAQIRTRGTGSGIALQFITFGWRDLRGKI